MNAITLRNASLNIHINTRETKSIKSLLLKSVTGGRLKKTSRGASIAALSGVTCDITHGERVALIGHNGSGKTSFLRLISGIYQCTSGLVEINCKVYPMIQKSFITGIDLSGFQAIKGHYLLTNNSLKGFKEYAEEIIDFSGLGDFIHMPMKGYSEGMSARLLFSLLTSGDHECLALDEGFGTGDSEFFDKAKIRLEKFISSAGTLVLASHSDDLLRKFCTRGLVFKKGKIEYDGDIEKSLHFYHSSND